MFEKLTKKHAKYPALLKEIFDPPHILILKGTMPSTDQYLSVVGSRHASDYGKRCAQMLISSLPKHITIVSGLAYGIDTSAHEAALRAHIPTIAVLAGGHHCITRRESLLAECIVKSGGGIISEHTPDTIPRKSYFPIRNRIISGISQATLIIEATKRSGTLITARSALEQNRDVLALPGPIDSPQSEGTNALIKDGAIPITNPADLLTYYQCTAQEHTSIEYTPKNQVEKSLLHVIGLQPVHIDILLQKTKLDISTTLSTLLQLKMNGVIIQDKGQRYRRSPFAPTSPSV